MGRKTLLVSLTAGIGLAAGISAFAFQQEHGHSPVKPLAKYDIQEKVDGKDTAATAVQVTYEAEQGGAPHRHPGPVFGYVLEGEFEWAINNEPAKVLKAGETFYEPAGCLHRVSRNASKQQVRVLAWVIHPRDSKQIVLPEAK